MAREAGSPGAWMVFARSDLALAKQGQGPGVLLEALCFHAQQAAEKALKAVLIDHAVPVPKVHSLERLVDLLPSGVKRTPLLAEVAKLSGYAVFSRYPSDDEPLAEAEYREAVGLAEAIVGWAEGIVGD